jgi:predicted nucleotidyltransferase
MARGEHHRIHAQDRSQRNRLRVAQEAARLMSEHGIRDFHHAKVKAAERLGVFDTQALPRNNEIEDALREHQRIFQADSQPQALRTRREAAIEAMRFFSAFEPRLVGAVLEGTADEHSAVCLHLFSDEVETVQLFLTEQGIPFDLQTRRLRLTRDEQAEYPVLLFNADGIGIDLTVMPHDSLRQPPLDRVDERPLRRASRSMVEALLTEQDMGEAGR